MRDADRVVGLLEAEDKYSPALIINRLNPVMVKNHDMLSADDVLDLLGIRLIGIVPEDDGVIIGSNRGAPVAADPKSKAGAAFRNIARRLQGEEVPFLEMEKQGGLWERISRMAGGRK